MYLLYHVTYDNKFRVAVLSHRRKKDFVSISWLSRVFPNLSRMYEDIRSLKPLFFDHSSNAVDKTLISFWRIYHGVFKVAFSEKKLVQSPLRKMLFFSENTSTFFTFISWGCCWTNKYVIFWRIIYSSKQSWARRRLFVPIIISTS